MIPTVACGAAGTAVLAGALVAVSALLAEGPRPIVVLLGVAVTALSTALLLLAAFLRGAVAAAVPGA